MYSKIPFGSGSSRFNDDFPQINSMPGPGSYEYDAYSMKSSPSKAPKFFQPSYNRSERFDSPRNSISSQTNNMQENITKHPKHHNKKPMKSSLSVKKSKHFGRHKISQGIVLL